MSSTRRLIRANATVVGFFLALTLALRVIVPAGFMPMWTAGTLTITICDGVGPQQPMAMVMPGMKHGDTTQHQAYNRCAFADLALPWLGSVDPVQLLAAIAFVLAMAFFAAPALKIHRVRRAWPPLRGPPHHT